MFVTISLLLSLVFGGNLLPFNPFINNAEAPKNAVRWQYMAPNMQGSLNYDWHSATEITWASYKDAYITCGEQCGDNMGLVFDPAMDYQAVSEGVGYGMLLAVMIGDQTTFDRIYKASERVMIDPSTGLMHWRVNRFGDITGYGAATDAELDKAAALIFAQARVDGGSWQAPEGENYDDLARVLLDDIYEWTVVDGRYLKPGDAYSGGGYEIINLSYFAPAWFRIFNQFEDSDRWFPLIDQGYESLYATAGSGDGLAPDWSTADGRPATEYCEKNGVPESICGYDMRYDAIRVLWRIGVDCMWFSDPQACGFIRRSNDFQMQLPEVNRGRMYDMRGSVVVDYHDIAMSGMWLVAAYAGDHQELINLFGNRLIGAENSYVFNNRFWGNTQEFYYNQTLALFASTLISGHFTNLYSG